MAGNWRVANSLVRLRDQVNARYPGRNKASDGTIGDTAHAGGTSDHNPNAQGVVTALDLTHDPKAGLDIWQLVNALANSRDGRIKYLIANNKIMVPSDYGWRWVDYTGDNPHTKHAHISVWGGAAGDQTNDWNIGGVTVAEPNINTIRIIHSEMEGWPLDEAHSGKHDAAFLAAKRPGEDTDAFIYRKWQQNGDFRVARETWRKFYQEWQPKLPGLLLEKNRADSLALQLKETNAKLAIQSDDTKLLNMFGEVLQKLIARFGLNKEKQT